MSYGADVAVPTNCPPVGSLDLSVKKKTANSNEHVWGAGRNSAAQPGHS